MSLKDFEVIQEIGKYYTIKERVHLVLFIKLNVKKIKKFMR